MRREFERRKKAWTSLAEWTAKSHGWLHAPVETIKAEEVQSQASGVRICPVV